MLTVFTLILHRELHQKAKSLVTEHANRMHVKPAAHAGTEYSQYSVLSFTEFVPNCGSFDLLVGSNAVTKQQYTHYEQ